MVDKLLITYQIDIWGIGEGCQYPPPPDYCATQFNNYFAPNGVPDEAKIHAAFDVAFQSIMEQLITNAANDPNYDGRYNCPNILEGRRYFPSNCMKYCFYNVNQKPRISEVACVKDYCCGVILDYCWDARTNNCVLVYENKFGDGSEECLIQPEPTLDGCPDGSYNSTRCFNSCDY